MERERRNGGHHESPTSRARAENCVSTLIPDTALWSPYVPLIRKPDELHHDGYRHAWELGHAGRYRPEHAYNTIQHETGSPAFPHMPGATRYLQERDTRNGPASSSVESSVNHRNSSIARSRGTEQAYSNLEPGRLATAQPLRQLSVSSKTSVVNNMNNEPSRSALGASKRPLLPSSPAYGTQHAPLEISSSPEVETKRMRKTELQATVPPKVREAAGPAGPISYEGFSRQELTKMLAETTNTRQDKVRYYAVGVGRESGVYLDWPSAERQVNGFPGAKHRKFKTIEDALAYVDKYRALAHNVPTMQTSRPMAPLSFESGYYSNSAQHEPYEPSIQQSRPMHVEEDLVRLSDGAMSVPNDEPNLVPEQQHVVDLILQGHNVFYTGSAGCGKSTILKAFVRQLQNRGKRVKIVAPTNLAALNIGGQTTWNFAGWTPDSMKKNIQQLKKNSLGKESWKKFDETDVLVIDEISMIENLQFERLNAILKHSRGEKHGGGAFGGIQLVVTGDVNVCKRSFSINS